MEKIEVSTVFKEDLYKLINKEKQDAYGPSGFTIRLYRLNVGWSSIDLAKKLKIRQSTLQKYEDGEKKVGIKLAKTMANLFGEDNWRVFRVGLLKSCVKGPDERIEELEKALYEIYEMCNSVSNTKVTKLNKRLHTFSGKLKKVIPTYLLDRISSS